MITMKTINASDLAQRDAFTLLELDADNTGATVE